MAHINICSIRNKITEISEILADNVHILAVSETHLDSSFLDESVMVEGYSIYRKDRNAYGGGVMFYVQNHIPVRTRYDLMTDKIEVLWLQVHLPHVKPILVGCGYRPPSANSEYMDNLCEMLEAVGEFNFEIYLLADFNIDWNSSTCSWKKRLHAFTSACGLRQMVNQPTRVSVKSNGTRTSTCIDHIFTNAGDKCSGAVSVAMGCSDHNLIAIVRKTKLPKPSPKILFKRVFKNFKADCYVEEVKTLPLSRVQLETKNAEKALDIFDDLFMPVVEKHAPLKKFTARSCRTPWLDNELKEHMMERDRAKQVANDSGLKSDWQVYCKYRNFVTSLNKRKKKLYYEDRIKNINNNSKKLWSVLNDVMGRRRNITPSYLEKEGLFLTKPADIANHIQNYFVDKINKLSTEMPVMENGNFNELINNRIMAGKNCQFAFSQVSESYIEKIILTGADKPAGIDGLENKLIKMVADIISPAICHIINLCFKESVCPSKWKIAKIIPLPKNAKMPFSGPNSRPISLLPCLGKLLERVVCDQIQDYFFQNNLITAFQHAYRKDYSTATALTQMTDDWLRAIDEQNLVGAVMLDFTAAFDIIEHDILLEKLHCYGFLDSSLTWMESYLKNRSQTVFFNGSYSEFKMLNCGVPQGSCLGPLLYTIYTNDLTLVVKQAKISMYADDSTIYVAAKTVEEVNMILNSELHSVVEWIQRNRLVLNVSKTNCITFGSNHTLKCEPLLNMLINDVKVNQVRETKLLGVTLDERLSWSTQINKTIAKMGAGISVIKRCTKYLTNTSKRQVIQALILSNMDYCPVVWSNLAKDKIKKLQVAQNRAARVVLNCDIRTNVIAMHEALSWLTVKNRFLYSLLVFFRNILTTKSPFILYNELSLTSDQHSFTTRQATQGNFILPRVRTNAMKRTMVYRGISEWNALPRNIKQENSKSTFKFLLKKYLLSRNVT